MTLPVRPEDLVPMERVGGSGRRSMIVAAFVMAALGLAILKPWAAPEGPGPAPAGPAAASAGVPAIAQATPAPTDDPVLEQARQRRQCQSPVDWRIVTMELAADRRMRTLFPVRPAVADGPADPGIEGHRVWASELLGLGVCVPRGAKTGLAGTAGALARVHIWQLHDDEAPVRLNALTTLDEPLMRLGEAYFGPPGSRGRSAVWPVGRYVFQIDALEDGGQPLWFALDYLGDGRTAAAGRITPA